MNHKLSQQTANEIYDKAVELMRRYSSKYTIEGHLKDYLNSLVETEAREDDPHYNLIFTGLCALLVEHGVEPRDRLIIDIGRMLEERLNKKETNKQIAVQKIHDYISENVTDYENQPVILSDVIDWLDKESEG